MERATGTRETLINLTLSKADISQRLMLISLVDNANISWRILD
jgi:hypothetical protein